MPAFEKGTLLIAKSVAKATSSGAFSLIGGGDSVAAIKKFNLQDEVSFISTGGRSDAGKLRRQNTSWNKSIELKK